MSKVKILVICLQIWVLGFHPLYSPETAVHASTPNTPPDGLNEQTGITAETWIYLPLLNTPNGSSNPPGPTTRRVNAPYIDPAISEDPLRDSAIFWFGKVTPDENYSDVRVRYESNRILIAVEVFDRLLWYDNSPSPDMSRYQSWDSVTLFIKTDANPAIAPSTSSYRIDAMINHYQAREDYQSVYKGNGSTWVPVDLVMNTTSSWSGDALNNMNEDRGWLMRFSIPYTSLGLTSMPREGALWQLGMIVYDRDDSSGRAINPQTWPENMQSDSPNTWGELYFGIPRLPDPSSPTTGTVMIRQGLNNAVVVDAAVGGTVDNLCPGDAYFIWNEWGNLNFSGAESLNIQNQANVADWPCFAKYFVTFPIDQIPPGKVIQSAALILHHWGNSGPSNLVEDSIIHVFSIAEDWNENTLTWNNAPMALENLDHIRIPKVECTNSSNMMNWPCSPRTWDVGRAVTQAYQQGQPVRLALYSSDTAMHSGKFFTSSDTQDWNESGRPTLIVTYGDR